MHECVRQWQQRFFYQLGYCASKHYQWTIALTVGVSLLLTTGIPHLRQVNSMRDYAPSDSKAVVEEQIALEYFQADDSILDRATIPLLPIDEGANLLNIDALDEVLTILDIIENEIAINVTYTARDNTQQTTLATWHALCRTPLNCHFNMPLRVFAQTAKRVLMGEHSSLLTYPVMKVLNNDLYIGDHVLKASTDNSSGILSSVGMYFIGLQAYVPHSEIFFAFNERVRKLVANVSFTHIKFVITDTNLISQGIQECSNDSIPYFIIGMLHVSAFVVLCSILTAYNLGKTTCYRVQITIGLCAVLLPTLAVAAMFGLLAYMGVVYKSIVIFIFFLVCGLGVDDSFLMLHTLRLQMQRHGSDDVPTIIANTMRIAGPGVTITSLTNVTSMAVGFYANTKAILTFTVFAVFSLAYAWLLQVTLYPALLTMCIYYEKRNISHAVNRQYCVAIKEHLRDNLQRFVIKYTKLVHKWYGGVFAIVILAIYLALAIHSLVNSNVSMDHRNLMARSGGWSEIADMSLRGIRETNSFFIIVNQPPDFHVIENRRLLNDLVDTIKSHKKNKVESAIFWLPEYMRYIQYERRAARNILPIVDGYDNSAVVFFYKELPHFVNQSNTLWSDMLRLNAIACEEESQYGTSFHDIANIDERYAVAQFCRYIVSLPRVLSWNATCFHDEGVFVESIGTADSTLLTTTTASIAFMLIICAVFMRNIRSILVAVTAILSMVAAFIGGLTMWGVHRDPILMINALIAIGLSVDFTSHILYHYDVHNASHCTQQRRDDERTTQNTTRDTNTSREENSVQEEINSLPPIERRLYETLNAVAWPIIQSATSSVICIVYLPLANAYVPEVFAKSILLINTIGLFYALVIIPILLIFLYEQMPKLFSYLAQTFRRSKAVDTEASTHPVRVISVQAIAED